MLKQSTGIPTKTDAISFWVSLYSIFMDIRPLQILFQTKIQSEYT